ncbi:hypothetical protein [Erwinia amylovora]
MSPIHFLTAPPPIPLRWDRHFQQRLAKPGRDKLCNRDVYKRQVLQQRLTKALNPTDKV